MLDDSEATLRLVDSILDELRVGEEFVVEESEQVAGVVPGLTSWPSLLANLPEILLRTRAEVEVVLESLQRIRLVLERSTLERVLRTQQEIQAVSSATEKAATEILDGLNRALVMVDQLDRSADSISTELRDELSHLISSLQFQDITAQQLGHTSRVLTEVEECLTDIADLLDSGLGEFDILTPDQRGTDLEVFSSASMFNAEERQAVTDDISDRSSRTLDLP